MPSDVVAAVGEILDQAGFTAEELAAELAPIGRASSSAGGVSLDEVDEHFMLRRRPGVYVVGEMLDWEAPTGGYLLQATFATAVTAARAAVTRTDLSITE